MAAVFFCRDIGVRIAAPGVSKRVDAVNGADEVVEDESGALVVVFPQSKKEPVADVANKPVGKSGK